MDDSGLDDQVNSFLAYEDNGSSEKVSQVVFDGNCTFILCTSLDSVGSIC